MKPVKYNLVALGSATVLAVYAAGYLRTKTAADRFVADDSERRRNVATTEHAPSPQPSGLTSKETVGSPEPGHARNPERNASSAPIVPPETRTAARRKAVDLPVAPPAATSAGAETTPPSGAESNGHAADSAAQDSVRERGPFRDGSFSGWGTSRHGDIEARVEVRDGRIVSASISQCYTRYSCSWIAALPPQVVARQSANVDYVSGATQSTNAFYYAIVEALAKAK